MTNLAAVRVGSEAGVRECEQFEIFTKKAWADEWTLNPYVEPVSGNIAAAPTVPQLQALYHYGSIKREDSNAYAIERPQSLANYYIQVRLINETAHGPIWTGRICAPAANLKGADTITYHPAPAIGDQMLTCFGLLHGLDRDPIRAAWVENFPGGATVNIGWMPSFNMVSRVGKRILGNRTPSKISSPEVYVFSRAHQTWDTATRAWTPDDANYVWTHKDILEYLFAFHLPEDGPEFKLTGQTDDLEDMVSVVNIEGLTFKQALDKLIPRHRGLSYYLSTGGEGDAVNVVVFTGTPKTIGSGRVRLSMNPRQFDMDVTEALDYDPVTARQNYSSKYGRVLVEGARIKACASWSWVDATFEESWTAAKEAEYRPLAGRKDKELEDYEHVYRRFRVPVMWPWKVKDKKAIIYNQVGQMYGTFVPEEVAQNIVNPKCGNDGRLLRTQAAYYNADKEFLRHLPFLVKTTKEQAEPCYQKLLVFVRDPKEHGAYYKIHELKRDAHHCNPCPTEREFAVDIVNSNHNLLALNHLDPTSCSPRPKHVPVYDYSTMIVTGFVETDERLKVIEKINDPSAPDVTEDLVISVPDAEMWFVTPNTIVDADAGILMRYEEKYNVSAKPYWAEDYLIRDDSDRLRTIAAFAKAWYGLPRGACSITDRKVGSGGLIGQILTTIQNGTQVEKINSPVTEIAWDFRARTTVIHTAWFELDLHKAAASVDVPGMSDLRSVGRAFARNERKLDDARERLAGIPATHSSPAFQLISDDKHVEDSAGDHDTEIARESNASRGGLYSMIIVRARPDDATTYLYEPYSSVALPENSRANKYGLMFHSNDPFVESDVEGCQAAPSSLDPEGGWRCVPGAKHNHEFVRDDQVVSPGVVGQDGDFFTYPKPTSMGKTSDGDDHVKVCARHDGIFYMRRDRRGRIYFVDYDAKNDPEPTGQSIKGDMVFDTSLAGVNSLHKPHDKGQWRPRFKWPITRHSSEFTIPAGSSITVDRYGLITGYTAGAPM